MPDFSRVINLAYQRILGRPADPGGLDAYNRAMNAGLTEADMREALLRSAEYASKHPDRSEGSATATTATARAGAKAAKKTKAKAKAGARTSSRKKKKVRKGKSS